MPESEWRPIQARAGRSWENAALGCDTLFPWNSHTVLAAMIDRLLPWVRKPASDLVDSSADSGSVVDVYRPLRWSHGGVRRQRVAARADPRGRTSAHDMGMSRSVIVAVVVGHYQYATLLGEYPWRQRRLGFDGGDTW